MENTNQIKSNQFITVAMDVDGTLIHLTGNNEDTPRYDVISVFKHFENLGCSMYVWSGGGVDYAKIHLERLGLSATVVEKGSFVPDITFDDENINLGKVNIRV